MSLKSPPFQISLLHPKYWPLWCGILLAYVISWLPYAVLYRLGRLLGKVLAVFGKQRVAIAKRNIELSFPAMSAAEQRALLHENVANTGLAAIETLMGWWWPDWRIRGISRVEGLHYLQAAQQQGTGVCGLAVHNMTLEVGCRIVGLHCPAVAFYRPHDNPVIEYMQYRGRARSNKYLISKRDLRSLFKALDHGELALYLPDQDYGSHNSEFVSLFAVENVATTIGPVILARRTQCATVMVNSFRDQQGRYVIKFYPGLKNFPDPDDKLNARRINQQVEKLIMEAPPQYLWMHKRYKTQPDPSLPSRYQ